MNILLQLSQTGTPYCRGFPFRLAGPGYPRSARVARLFWLFWSIQDGTCSCGCQRGSEGVPRRYFRPFWELNLGPVSVDQRNPFDTLRGPGWRERVAVEAFQFAQLRRRSFSRYAASVCRSREHRDGSYRPPERPTAE